MVRYSRSTSVDINRCIHDANIANFSEQGTIQYIKDNTGVTVGHALLVERKRILRNRAIKSWQEYRNDEYAYRLEHLQRKAEAKRVLDSAMSKMLEYEKNPKTFFHWKASAYAVLEASRYLAELDEKIPEIDVIGRDYDNEIQQEIPTVSRTSEDSEAIF